MRRGGYFVIRFRLPVRRQLIPNLPDFKLCCCRKLRTLLNTQVELSDWLVNYNMLETTNQKSNKIARCCEDWKKRVEATVGAVMSFSYTFKATVDKLVVCELRLKEQEDERTQAILTKPRNGPHNCFQCRKQGLVM